MYLYLAGYKKKLEKARGHGSLVLHRVSQNRPDAVAAVWDGLCVRSSLRIRKVLQWAEEEKRQNKLVSLLERQRDIKLAEAARALQAERETIQQVKEDTKKESTGRISKHSFSSHSTIKRENPPYPPPPPIAPLSLESVEGCFSIRDKAT